MNPNARRAPAHRENRSGRDIQLHLDYSGRRNALREFLTDETHVKHLLRVLMDHTPQNETDCFLTIDTICREMSAKRRTVQKAISDAKRQGFLIVYGPSRTRNCNTYRLRFAEIREAAEFERAVRQAWMANHEECWEQFRDHKSYLKHLQATVADRAEYAQGWRNMCATPAQDVRSGSAEPAPRNSKENKSKNPIKNPIGHEPKTRDANHNAPENGDGDGFYKKPLGGWDDPITIEQMTDAEWCQRRYLEAVRKRWIKDSVQNRQDFFGASVACVHADGIDEPPAFFTSCLKRKTWPSIRQADEDEARMMISALDAAERKPLPIPAPMMPVLPGHDTTEFQRLPVSEQSTLLKRMFSPEVQQ